MSKIAVITDTNSGMTQEEADLRKKGWAKAVRTALYWANEE